jgi:type VI protein secretion system component Hcp
VAISAFLKLDDVTGDSVVAGHEGEIELLTVVWDEGRRGAGPSSTGMVPGTLSIGEVRVTTIAGKAGPKLMIRCAQGTRSANGAITFVNDATPRDAFTTIRMTDVLVDSYTHAGSGDVPVDQISLSFTSIQIEYRPASATGAPGTPITGIWRKS